MGMPPHPSVDMDMGMEALGVMGGTGMVMMSGWDSRLGWGWDLAMGATMMIFAGKN
jgi:hypothetical protein